MSQHGKTNASDGWSSALGYAWTEMLRGQRLNPSGTVVEIGPGFTDKIARGLAALNFRGTVVLVEPNEAAGEWALERYRRLLPQAKVMVAHRPVPGGSIPHKRPVDALLSNHILDDLILNAALPQEASAGIFTGMRPGAPCSQMFVRRWRELLKPSETLAQLIAQVAEDFTNYVAQMQPRLVLLNQYPSWRHNLHGLGSIHTQALRLMRLIEASLGAVCVEANAFPGFSDHSSMRWLIGKPNGNTVRCCAEDAHGEQISEGNFRV